MVKSLRKCYEIVMVSLEVALYYAKGVNSLDISLRTEEHGKGELLKLMYEIYLLISYPNYCAAEKSCRYFIHFVSIRINYIISFVCNYSRGFFVIL